MKIYIDLKKIISNLPGHVYWKDTEGKYLGCNLLQATDLGFVSSDELIGKTDYDLSSKNAADKFRAIDKKVIQEKREIEAEEIISKHGKKAVVLSKKIPLFDDKNTVVGILGISFDITDRKALEMKLKAAKEKVDAVNYMMTEFISNMGHDLATPISDVGSIAQLLKFYSDEYPELRELFDSLEARSEACEAVRKKILDATSISNFKVKVESFSIVQVLLDLEKELRPAIGEKPIKIILQPLKPKKKDQLETDKEKFHAILFDLIENAIHFTEEGEVTISVSKKDKYFHIAVSDTGIGIPPDKYDFIFQQYTKLSRSNKYGANFKGVGAGLYLARIRANILNATISVESILNKGSVFLLSIPVHYKKTN